jgi:hypothetical protein
MMTATPPDDASQFRRTKGKSKGKQKGKGDGGSNSAAEGMVGCVGRDGNNRAICFNYNWGTCDKAPAGGSCSKGRHVCFKAGCFKVHPYNFKEARTRNANTKGC